MGDSGEEDGGGEFALAKIHDHVKFKSLFKKFCREGLSQIFNPDSRFVLFRIWVEWEGYPRAHEWTWEPEENLTDNEIFEAYKRKHGMSKEHKQFTYKFDWPAVLPAVADAAMPSSSGSTVGSSRNAAPLCDRDFIGKKKEKKNTKRSRSRHSQKEKPVEEKCNSKKESLAKKKLVISSDSEPEEENRAAGKRIKQQKRHVSSNPQKSSASAGKGGTSQAANSVVIENSVVNFDDLPAVKKNTSGKQDKSTERNFQNKNHLPKTISVPKEAKVKTPETEKKQKKLERKEKDKTGTTRLPFPSITTKKLAAEKTSEDNQKMAKTARRDEPPRQEATSSVKPVFASTTDKETVMKSTLATKIQNFRIPKKVEALKPRNNADEAKESITKTENKSQKSAEEKNVKKPKSNNEDVVSAPKNDRPRLVLRLPRFHIDNTWAPAKLISSVEKNKSTTKKKNEKKNVPFPSIVVRKVVIYNESKAQAAFYKNLIYHKRSSSLERLNQRWLDKLKALQIEKKQRKQFRKDCKSTLKSLPRTTRPPEIFVTIKGDGSKIRPSRNYKKLVKAITTDIFSSQEQRTVINPIIQLSHFSVSEEIERTVSFLQSAPPLSLSVRKGASAMPLIVEEKQELQTEAIEISELITKKLCNLKVTVDCKENNPGMWKQLVEILDTVHSVLDTETKEYIESKELAPSITTIILMYVQYDFEPVLKELKRIYSPKIRMNLVKALIKAFPLNEYRGSRCKLPRPTNFLVDDFTDSLLTLVSADNQSFRNGVSLESPCSDSPKQHWKCRLLVGLLELLLAGGPDQVFLQRDSPFHCDIFSYCLRFGASCQIIVLMSLGVPMYCVRPVIEIQYPNQRPDFLHLAIRRRNLSTLLKLIMGGLDPNSVACCYSPNNDDFEIVSLQTFLKDEATTEASRYCVRDLTEMMHSLNSYYSAVTDILQTLTLNIQRHSVLCSSLFVNALCPGYEVKGSLTPAHVLRLSRVYAKAIGQSVISDESWTQFDGQHYYLSLQQIDREAVRDGRAMIMLSVLGINYQYDSIDDVMQTVFGSYDDVPDLKAHLISEHHKSTISMKKTGQSNRNQHYFHLDSDDIDNLKPGFFRFVIEAEQPPEANCLLLLAQLHYVAPCK